MSETPDQERDNKGGRGENPASAASKPCCDGAEGCCREDGDCGSACADNRTGCRDCSRRKLHSFNYLADIPGGFADSDWVEVQFKNTRKGYYRNTTHLDLAIGDVVAVEAAPGHDIGTITMTGILAELRMKKATARAKDPMEVKRVFRKAKDVDIEKFNEARGREEDTMIRSRKIAESLGLNMKIGDVEYQGDGNKAIFYYIADERVDFRQLIKILAETFRVRIEMRQIGARQEAGRIGGIGPCGRPLCCSLWMTNFVSVSTSAARYQDISMNPQKLAGQCAKLKCCLNFEVEAYVNASSKMPPKDTRLETADALYYTFKSDVFNRTMTFSTDKNIAANLVTLPAERVFEILKMNAEGIKPVKLQEEGPGEPKPKAAFGDILDGGDLTRFDKKKKKKKNFKDNKGPKGQDKPRQGDKESERPNDKSADKGNDRQNERGKDRRPKNRRPKDRKDNPDKGPAPENQ